MSQKIPANTDRVLNKYYTMNFFQRTYAAWRELMNFFFVRRVIKRNQKTDKWKSFKLRSGWLNQIYTVINLRKEDMGEEEDIRKMRVIEKIEPMNRYMEDLNLAEVMSIEFNDIDDTRSYLIIYWPLWNYFSLWRLIFWITGILISYKIIVHYDLINKVTELVTKIIEYVN